MKADLRISIKDYHQNQNPAPTTTRSRKLNCGFPCYSIAMTIHMPSKQQKIMHIIKQIISQCLLLRTELREKKAIDLLNKIQSMLFALEFD